MAAVLGVFAVFDDAEASAEPEDLLIPFFQPCGVGGFVPTKITHAKLEAASVVEGRRSGVTGDRRETSDSLDINSSG